MRSLVTVVLLIVLSSGACIAQQQVPPASMDKLQTVFTVVRDKLWDSNDDYWHHGWFDRCIASMRMIAQIDPHDSEAYIDAAWLMDSDVREEEAEAFLREGVANTPDTYDVYFELGTFLYMRMRFDESIPYLAVAATRDAPPFVWHQLAHAYERDGRIGDCLNTWFEAQAIEPDSPIPAMQIDRILHGGEPTRSPENVVQGIAERKKDKQAEQQQ